MARLDVQDDLQLFVRLSFAHEIVLAVGLELDDHPGFVEIVVIIVHKDCSAKLNKLCWLVVTIQLKIEYVTVSDRTVPYLSIFVVAVSERLTFEIRLGCGQNHDDGQVKSRLRQGTVQYDHKDNIFWELRLSNLFTRHVSGWFAGGFLFSSGDIGGLR